MLQPPKPSRKRKLPAIPEKEIQRSILDWLEAVGVMHWRQNLGAVLVRRGTALAYAKNPMKGFPDVAGVSVIGQMFVIEVKNAKGRLSEEQLSWKEKLEGSGVFYVLARSAGEAIDQMTPWLSGQQERFWMPLKRNPSPSEI